MKILLVWTVVSCLFPGAISVGEEGEGKAYWLRQAQHSLQAALSLTPNTQVAHNVILFLGDGMGVSTVTAARIYKGQKDGRPGEETQLNFEKFPYTALSKTYNVDKQTSDSAGTATAFLCGVKTNYGTLGVDSRVARANCTHMDRPDVLTQSVLDWSYAAGKSVGIVTTARVTHATPAAAFAHTPERNWETDKDIPADCPQVADIAFQLLKNNSHIQVILGGGRREFYNRKDDRSLPEEWLSEMRAKGLNAQYVTNASDFRAVPSAEVDNLLGLFTESHMSYELSRDNEEEPSITEMTRKAIEILSKNPAGFFLLVEGGRIDHGHHQNWAKRALEETTAFDDAVAAARNMTGDDTLMVVTADHSHVFNIAGYPSRGNNILGLVDELRANDVPIDGLPYTTLVYGNGPGPNRSQDLTDVDTTVDDFRYQTAVPKQDDSETHSGEDVAIYAMGPMAHLFHGVHEQNYIAHVMAYAACVGPNKAHCDPPSTPKPSPDCTGGAATVGRDRGSVVMVMVVVAALMLAGAAREMI
ncbi:alkaline phosphatase-like [Babylonia areolata]|uniref:alkaline phosphatase-like n=1 Tax=Babylonia areolata TaxID=304850 RepID=UPI003FD0237C